MDDLSGLPGCDINNNPQTVFLWMNAEIRNLPMCLSDMFLFDDIWVGAFTKIGHALRKRRIKYKLCDLYNATWAYFGYTVNQCPVAIRFASLVKDNLG
jgi:hypothetical protein